MPKVNNCYTCSLIIKYKKEVEKILLNFYTVNVEVKTNIMNS